MNTPPSPDSILDDSEFWESLRHAHPDVLIVLIVEDELPQQKSLQERVRHLVSNAIVIPVGCSDDAREVLRKLKAIRLAIAVAIVDLKLPKTRYGTREDAVPDNELPWLVGRDFAKSIRIHVSASAQDLMKLETMMRHSGQSSETLAEQGTHFLAKDELWPRSLDQVLRRALLNRRLEDELEDLNDGGMALDTPARFSHGRARGRAEDAWLREALLAEEAKRNWEALFPGLKMRLSQRLSLHQETHERILGDIDTTINPSTDPEEPRQQT
jgi:hypothetical protein